MTLCCQINIKNIVLLQKSFSEMWWDGFKKNWNSQTRLVGTLRGFFLKTGTDNKLDERHTM